MEGLGKDRDKGKSKGKDKDKHEIVEEEDTVKGLMEEVVVDRSSCS